MKVLTTHNVQTALPLGIDYLSTHGVWVDTRNGKALVSPEPVTTHYLNPTQRVIFWAARDANPFFHIYEAMWMLLGRNDVESVAGFAKQMREYSDDGKTLAGAYGYRWRKYFGANNLRTCITQLQLNPSDRRVILGMYDPKHDPDLALEGKKDIPCNLSAKFSKNPTTGCLDMTVFNRSNDIVWGAYGANAVHFSFLQEYVAITTGMEVGNYWQVSADFHIYEDHYNKLKDLPKAIPELPMNTYNPYRLHPSPKHPLMSVPESHWLDQLAICLDDIGPYEFTDPWIKNVLYPVLSAHKYYKSRKGEERYIGALNLLTKCENWDWYRACAEWINRRYQAWERAKDDGVNYESQ